MKHFRKKPESTGNFSYIMFISFSYEKWKKTIFVHFMSTAFSSHINKSIFDENSSGVYVEEQEKERKYMDKIFHNTSSLTYVSLKWWKKKYENFPLQLKL